MKTEYRREQNSTDTANRIQPNSVYIANINAVSFVKEEDKDECRFVFNLSFASLNNKEVKRSILPLGADLDFVLSTILKANPDYDADELFADAHDDAENNPEALCSWLASELVGHQMQIKTKPNPKSPQFVYLNFDKLIKAESKE